jgi:branched-chain amino acid transport system permease protein
MRAVMALCDRIVVFNRGEVLAEGAPHDVMHRPEVVSAYLGQAMEPESAGPANAPPANDVERELAHA